MESTKPTFALNPPSQVNLCEWRPPLFGLHHMRRGCCEVVLDTTFLCSSTFLMCCYQFGFSVGSSTSRMCCPCFMFQFSKASIWFGVLVILMTRLHAHDISYC